MHIVWSEHREIAFNYSKLEVVSQRNMYLDIAVYVYMVTNEWEATIHFKSVRY